MMDRGKSDSPSWRKSLAGYVVAVVSITGIVEIAHWPVLVGLLGLPAGAFIFWRWAP